MSSFYEKGLNFGCTRCSQCCRHDSGYVFLSKADLIRLCSVTMMTEADFLVKFCKSVDFGVARRISLIEKENKDCIFWDTEGCKVYEGRPLQCRTYPFWPQLMDKEAWEGEKERCPGINDGGKYHTAHEIDAQLSARDREPLIDLSN